MPTTARRSSAAMPPRHWLALLGAAVLSLALGGCVTLPRTPFTAAQQAVAAPVGFQHIRYAQDDPALAEMLGRTLKPDDLGVVNTLAISGGGANGAYAAGVIYGWTKTGQRPNFQLVTGVSAGALAAPFAFLGPSWDEHLRRTYFDRKINNLLQGRGFLRLLTPGLYRKEPLNELVRAYVTESLLAAIAAEHAKGRRLLVATTDLDTEQLVVWDMGAIASRGGPAARDLFAQVLIASATVPGVFEPTMIKVQGQGRSFEEMHVDGSADSAFFAIPQAVFLGLRTAGSHNDHRLFILVNGQLNSPFAVTPRATLPVLRRTVDAASKASIRSALLATLQFCQRQGCHLNVSAVPVTEKDDPLDFSAAHLQSLFAAGQVAAESGTAWRTVAPALAEKPAPAPAAPAGTP